MTKARKAPHTAPPTSYELLGERLQRAINAPAAQLSKSATLERLPSDIDDDWDLILGEISENDNVTVAHRDYGHVQLFWTVPAQD